MTSHHRRSGGDAACRRTPRRDRLICRLSPVARGDPNEYAELRFNGAGSTRKPTSPSSFGHQCWRPKAGDQITRRLDRRKEWVGPACDHMEMPRLAEVRLTDPITVEVIRDGLLAAAEAMAGAVSRMRTSFI